MNKFIPLGIMALLTTASCTNQSKIEYPEAPSDGTTYEAFGMTVNDNYRPLENDTSAATAAWVDAENKITRDYIDNISFRDDIHKRLTALNRYDRNGLPAKENDGNYYFFFNDGSKSQSILYRVARLGDEPEVFIDPNALSEDGTVALTGVFQSRDGRYTAYTISRSGSDWSEIYVMNTATKELLPDHIEWAKFTGAVWRGDGFYYSAYERPEAGKEFSNANEYHKVYFHKLGTPQSEDAIAYENKNEPLHFHSVGISNDESVLIIAGAGQGHGNSLKVKDLKRADSPWITLEDSQEYTADIIDAIDDNIYLFTSIDAPMNRLVKIDMKRPGRENWVEIIPEDSSALLTGVQFAGNNRLIATYEKDAASHAYIYDINGEKIREVEFPTYGTAAFSSDRKSDEVFYSFASFVNPASIYSYDIASGESTLYKATAIDGINPEDYVTEQVFYTSKDGTKIPMFIVYRKDLQRNGNNPTLLYGYGGFGVTLTPRFSANRLLWLENGGIYAQANLRGGNEYGEAWHNAGTKMNKLNVFDDFIAAGEYMINEGWTKTELMAAEGGSNGGLLVGATVNIRPDLFKVAIPHVGVMDMMRYHLFTIGWNWAHDYGTADDSAEMAKYLHEYSPIHNIKNDGTEYPAILVTTADHDDRVVPAHSFKYAATLQAANTGNNPKLIRIESKAGHGAGKPISKVIDENADVFSFIYKNIGVEPETSIKKASEETQE